MKKILLGLVIASGVLAQSPQQLNNVSGINWSVIAPSAPTNLTASTSIVGVSNYYYWIVSYAMYNGNPVYSTPIGPAMVQNGPNTIDSSHAVNVGWSLATGNITGYYLLRTSTNTLPSGSANMLVAQIVSPTTQSYQDIVTSPTSFSLASGSATTPCNWTISNGAINLPCTNGVASGVASVNGLTGVVNLTTGNTGFATIIYNSLATLLATPCTPGYIGQATDVEQFYSCVATNTWELINPASSTLNAAQFCPIANGIVDDTSCMQAFITAVNAGNGSIAGYIPSGKYLVNGTLRSTVATTFYGDGTDNTFVIETNATSDLWIAYDQTQQVGVGWSPGPIFNKMSFGGQGVTTTGNLLVDNANGRAIFDTISFFGHNGTCFADNSERTFFNNNHFSHCKQDIVFGDNVSVNESYFTNLTVMHPGYVQNDLGTGSSSASYCWSPNGNSLPLPTSGTFIQSIYAGIEVGVNSTNIHFSNISIKPDVCIAGLLMRAPQDLTINNFYFEGFAPGSTNPSIIYGGVHFTAIGSNAINNSQLVFDTDSTNSPWFEGYVGNVSDLPISYGPIQYVIRPPDYIVGSSAASSLGGGILKGSFEYVWRYGQVHDSSGSGWHQQLSTRGQNGTTALAWPSGFILEEGWDSNPLGPNEQIYAGYINIDTGSFGSMQQSPTCIADPDNGHTCGEIVLGRVGDAFYVGGSSNVRLENRVIELGDQIQTFCHAGTNTGKIDAYNAVDVIIKSPLWSWTDLDGNYNGVGGAGTNNLFVPETCGIVREITSLTGQTDVKYADTHSSWQVFGPSTQPITGYGIADGQNSNTATHPSIILPPSCSTCYGQFSILAENTSGASGTPNWELEFTNLSAGGLNYLSNGVIEDTLSLAGGFATFNGDLNVGTQGFALNLANVTGSPLGGTASPRTRWYPRNDVQWCSVGSQDFERCTEPIHIVVNPLGSTPITPIFDFGSTRPNGYQFNDQYTTLTTNVTSSTAVNFVTGVPYTVTICEPSTVWSFVLPSNVINGTYPTSANSCTSQIWISYDGVNMYAIGGAGGGGGGGGTDPYAVHINVSTPQNMSGNLNSPCLNSNCYVDGFTSTYFPGIGSAQVAWNNTSGYGACQSVSYSSNNYILVTTANTGTTPGTNNAVWWPIPTSATPTQTICAFYWSVALANSYNGPVALFFGSHSYSSPYTISMPLVEPATAFHVNLMGSGVGWNGGLTQLQATNSMGFMLSAADKSGSLPYGFSIQSIMFNGNNLATGCWSIYGEKEVFIQWLGCQNFASANIESAAVWGDETYSNHNGGYQWTVNHVFIQGSGANGGNALPVLSVTGTGSSLTTSCTANCSYTYTNQPGRGFFWGFGYNNTAPCSTYSTSNTTVTYSSSHFSSMPISGVSGCVGPYYAIAPDIEQQQYGITINNITDSTFNDLIVNNVGLYRGIYLNGGGTNTFNHPHVYTNGAIGIDFESGGANTITGAEVDTQLYVGIQDASSTDNWIGTQIISGGGVAQAPGMLAFKVPLGTKILGQSCGNSSTSGNVFNLVYGPSGIYPHGGPFGTSTVIGAQDCDTLQAENWLPTSLNSNIKTVSYSTTPVFALPGDQQITLTGNVVSSSVTGLTQGLKFNLRICQDATGSRTFAWPTNFSSTGVGTIGTTPSTCNIQAFESYDGTTVNAQGPMVTNQ